MKTILFLLICFPLYVYPWFSAMKERVAIFYEDHKTQISTTKTVILTAIPCIFAYPAFIIAKNAYRINHVKRIFSKHGITKKSANSHYQKMIKVGLIAKDYGLEGVKMSLKERGHVDSFRIMCDSNNTFTDAIADIAGVKPEDIFMLRHVIILLQNEE